MSSRSVVASHSEKTKGRKGVAPRLGVASRRDLPHDQVILAISSQKPSARWRRCALCSLTTIRILKYEVTTKQTYRLQAKRVRGLYHSRDKGKRSASLVLDEAEHVGQG